MSNVQGKKRAGSFKKSEKDKWNKPKKAFMQSASNVSALEKRSYGAHGGNSVIKIRKTLFPVPDVLVTKLRTSQTFNITTGASGALSSTRTYLNSAYDPFAAAGSNQPRFFDQMMALYYHYCVYGAKVKVKILSKALGTQDNNVRIIALASEAQVFPLASLYNDGREVPKMLVWDLNAGTSAANPSTIFTLTDKAEKSMYVDIPQFFGLDKQQYMTEQNFKGTATSDPTSIMSLYTAMQGYEAAQTDTAVIEISLVQYVAFTRVQTPTTST